MTEFDYYSVTMSISQATVCGTGAWGTTFAQILADAGMKVTIWGRNAATVADINAGENRQYLPGIPLSHGIHATTDLRQAVSDTDLLVVAIPVAGIRSLMEKCAQLLPENAAIVSLSKGLEQGTFKNVHTMICESASLAPNRVAALSGPNLSREIAQHHPTATVVACSDTHLAAQIAKACHTPYFRPYVSADVLGCEIAGATKNVIAVAIGAAEGHGVGINSRATLITRGLAEITRLGTAVGADPATFAGLAGVGDLMATCSSKLSRNYSFGYRLGQGMSVADALEASAGVVEGARSAQPILELAHSLGVDMPITESVVRIIHHGASVAEMGHMLLSRPQKMDGWKIELL